MKCNWEPFHFATWLGHTWFMFEGVLRVSLERIEQILQALSHILEQIAVTGRVLFPAKCIAGVIGQIIAMQSVIGLIVRLRTRALYKCLIS